jgi:hypothetical protein
MDSMMRLKKFPHSGFPFSNPSLFPDISQEPAEKIDIRSSDTPAFLFLVVMVMIIAALFCFKSEIIDFFFFLAGAM